MICLVQKREPLWTLSAFPLIINGCLRGALQAVGSSVCGTTRRRLNSRTTSGSGGTVAGGNVLVQFGPFVYFLPPMVGCSSIPSPEDLSVGHSRSGSFPWFSIRRRITDSSVLHERRSTISVRQIHVIVS